MIFDANLVEQLGGWPYLALATGSLIVWVIGNIVLARIDRNKRRTKNLYRAFVALQFIYLVIVAINILQIQFTPVGEPRGFFAFWLMVNEGLRVIVLLGFATVTFFLTLLFQSLRGFSGFAAVIAFLFWTNYVERAFEIASFGQ